MLDKKVIKEALHEVLDERPCSVFSKEQVENIYLGARVVGGVKNILTNSFAIVLVLGVVAAIISIIYFGVRLPT